MLYISISLFAMLSPQALYSKVWNMYGQRAGIEPGSCRSTPAIFYPYPLVPLFSLFYFHTSFFKLVSRSLLSTLSSQLFAVASFLWNLLLTSIAHWAFTDFHFFNFQSVSLLQCHHTVLDHSPSHHDGFAKKNVATAAPASLRCLECKVQKRYDT